MSRRDVPLLMGDINGKMGSDNAGGNAVMWQYAVGQIDENCELVEDICSINHLVTGGNLFACKQLFQTTWVSTGRYIMNEINHITTSLTDGLQTDTSSISIISLLSDNWLSENEIAVEKAARLDNNVALCWRQSQGQWPVLQGGTGRISASFLGILEDLYRIIKFLMIWRWY